VIRIGTSGFSYEDWVGPFYPPATPRGRFLEFYAREFDVVEINSTYYAPPSARTMAGLVERTGGGVGFSIKANRRMTHDRDADDEHFRGFREALAPLVEAGVLGAVLAQFPQSLKPDREGRAALESVHGGLEGLPLVFEFRDRTWADDRVFSWMQHNGVSLCCVDCPPLPGLFPPIVEVTCPDRAYVRCHGRNAGSWYEHEHAYERYDYRYSDEETRQVASVVRRLARKAGDVFVFYNNHYQAKAVDGARRLRQELAR
jgi:uncharacterized protein YecE (DUF72 family)